MDALNKEDGESLSIVDKNIDALKDIFPDAFTEGGIDFEALRLLLGNEIVDGEEKYGLNWHGKKKARQIALTASYGTLRPSPKESVNWSTTQNLFIEGDNLEALKLLQKSYAGRVKMIYIDPPYNTGKEFIYPDKYQDNLDTYLQYTGQKTEEGLAVTSNTESSGRFHTNWLNMMYPRLFVAKALLSQDGVIMISIDEKECCNLRQICEQIFGSENFVAQFSVVTNYKGRNDKTNVAMAHEYVLAFRKNGFETGGLPLTEAQRAEYKLTDENGKKYKLRDLRKRGGPDNRSDRPRMWFPLFLNEKTKKLSFERLSEADIEITPVKSGGVEGRWRWGKDKTKENLDILEAKYVKKSDKWNVSYRIYLDSAGPTPIEGEEDLDEDEFEDTSSTGSIPKSIWMGGEFSSDAGSRALKSLIPGTSLEYPKSVELLKRCIYYGTKEDDIVLDFFFGSGTLGQALFEVERENPRGRKFIGIQLPEELDAKAPAYKAGYRTISQIAADRLRKAGQAILDEKADYDGDIGFKYFKLDSSNIRKWNPDSSDLEKSLLDHSEHLVEGRTEQDVLYELLLKRGVDLTVPIEEKEIEGKTVYSIGFGVLFACLDKTIDKGQIEAIGKGISDWCKELEPAADTQVVFRDSAFEDNNAKLNMTAILEQNGIAHVRSL